MTADLPLRDIHLPPSIGWWPPAIGFWMVGGLLLMSFLFGAWRLWKYRQPSLQKSARQELAHIEARFQSHALPSICLSELSQWLRRVVLSQNSQSAGVTGKAWLELLDKSLPQPAFSQGAGQILLKGPYQLAVEEKDVLELIQLCHTWVKRL